MAGTGGLDGVKLLGKSSPARREGALIWIKGVGASGACQGCFDYDRELSETNMSKRAFNKIMQGVEEARAYLEGTADKSRYRVHVPDTVNIKKIRRRLGLSQESFALSAVRDWEQGRRKPERSARILLKIVEKEPEAVTRALAG
jgi:putative transcriptional regulator